MAEPFLSEIRTVPFNFAPLGWALCNGQILPISQNTALFSLIGTFYGGNGTSNFALPNLQGSVPVGMGQGPGLSFYTIGQTGGASEVTLTAAQLSSHDHSVRANSGFAVELSPAGHVPAKTMRPLYSATAASTAAAGVIVPSGQSQPHNNLQPYLCLTFIIALQGVYPPRQ
jgi:microcystin-dependent protein